MPDEKLLPCPHCGHQPHEPERIKSNTWGEWDWVIICSSSHCRARVQLIADGWTDGDRNRLTDIRRMWNRRYRNTSVLSDQERQTLRSLAEGIGFGRTCDALKKLLDAA